MKAKPEPDDLEQLVKAKIDQDNALIIDETSNSFANLSLNRHFEEPQYEEIMSSEDSRYKKLKDQESRRSKEVELDDQRPQKQESRQNGQVMMMMDEGIQEQNRKEVEEVTANTKDTDMFYKSYSYDFKQSYINL